MEYARDRFITVVFGIGMPRHSQTALERLEQAGVNYYRGGE